MTGKICPVCRIGFRGKVCPRCGDREQRRAQTRSAMEPWRALYGMEQWGLARRDVLRRDGRRCRIVEQGVRCEQTRALTVDHAVPLREIWKDVGLPMDQFSLDWASEYPEGWRKFVNAATRTRVLLTVCRSHHARIEAARRDEARLDARLAGRRR